MTNFLKNNSISFHKILKSCADSTTKIFLPILIYQLTKSLPFVFIFLAVYSLLASLLNIVLKKIIGKKTLFLASISFIPFVLILTQITFLPLNIYGVISVGVLSALGSVLYYAPINIIFTTNTKTNNIAKFNSAAIIGKIIFTFTTAYLIGNSFDKSFVSILIIGTLLYLLSSVMLLLNAKEINNTLSKNVAKPIIQSIELNKKYNLIHVFFGIYQCVIDTILPLFLFYLNFNITQIAFLIIISEIVKIGSNYFAKYRSSINKDGIVIFITCLLYAIVVALIPIVKSVPFYYAISIALPLSFPLIHVSIFTRYIKHIKSNDDFISGLILRDVYIFAPRVFVYSTFFIASSFTPIFILGSVSAIGIIISSVKFNNKKQPLQMLKEDIYIDAPQ